MGLRMCLDEQNFQSVRKAIKKFVGALVAHVLSLKKSNFILRHETGLSAAISLVSFIENKTREDFRYYPCPGSLLQTKQKIHRLTLFILCLKFTQHHLGTKEQKCFPYTRNVYLCAK